VLIGKNVQNLARFWSILDFDRKYLRNGSRYHTESCKSFTVA